ncbi:MAG: hypothetical protein PHH77_07785 [Victivallaceae bacterium]|nr:hypothetical protein [Victivallaceae bacterium]
MSESIAGVPRFKNTALDSAQAEPEQSERQKRYFQKKNEVSFFENVERSSWTQTYNVTFIASKRGITKKIPTKH